MVLTNFPDGVTSFGIPLVGSSIPTGGGKYLFVDSVNGNDGNDGSWDTPLATIDYAIGLCTANKGDVIVAKPGHAETVASASAITFDVAGVSLWCLGNGAERATLTFSSSASASVVISAANVTIRGLRGVAAINALTTPITITGDNADVDIEWHDGSTSIEALYIVRATTVSNLTLNLVAKNFIGGTGGTSAVGLVAVTKARVNLDVYGKWSTSALDMLTTLSTDVEVRGTIYNTSSSSGNKDVTATIGSCTWFAEIWDAQAGKMYTGGSGTSGTLSTSDPSAIGTDVTTILTELAGTGGITTWPTPAAAYGNTVSIAEVLAYIQDAVRNGSGSGMPTNKGLADLLGAGFTGAAAHTLQAALGTDGTTVLDSATSVLGAIGADNNNNAFDSSTVVAAENGSVFERLEQLQKAVNNGSGTAIATNKSIVDLLGTDGSATADSAVSVLGIIGTDTATTAFASTSVVANEDGNVLERLEQLQKAVNNGSGTAIGTNKSIVDLLGTNGTVTADSAVSVLGIIGTDTATTAFASTNVVANEDGNVLERLEQLQKAVNNGSGTAVATNKSLIDCLGTTGSATADSATSVVGILGSNTATTAFASGSVVADVDGNILERLEALAVQTAASAPSVKNPNYFVITADMTSATWNTQDSHTIANVTGMVQMTIIPQCTSTLTDAANAANIQLGITGTTNAIIASTGAAGAGGATISTNEFWVDATPTEVIVTRTALDALTVIVGGGIDVGYEITGEALTGGTLLFHVYWTPLDSTGAVAAGNGAALA